MDDKEEWKTNKTKWKSKAFFLPVSPLACTPPFEWFLFTYIYLTCLSHQKGVWSTSWNVWIHLHSHSTNLPGVTYREKCRTGTQGPGRLGGFLSVIMWWGNCLPHFHKGYFKLCLVAFTNSLKWGKKLTKLENQDTHYCLTVRKELRCNYKALSVRLWTVIQSFTWRVVCSLWGNLQPSCLGVKNAFRCSFIKASLTLNRGIVSSRKLNESTSGLLWHKSCVFIHMSLKKFNTLVVSGKFKMRNIWNPRPCFSVVVSFWLQAPGRIHSRPSRWAWVMRSNFFPLGSGKNIWTRNFKCLLKFIFTCIPTVLTYR